MDNDDFDPAHIVTEEDVSMIALLCSQSTVEYTGANLGIAKSYIHRGTLIKLVDFLYVSHTYSHLGTSNSEVDAANWQFQVAGFRLLEPLVGLGHCCRAFLSCDPQELPVS